MGSEELRQLEARKNLASFKVRVIELFMAMTVMYAVFGLLYCIVGLVKPDGSLVFVGFLYIWGSMMIMTALHRWLYRRFQAEYVDLTEKIDDELFNQPAEEA